MLRVICLLCVCFTFLGVAESAVRRLPSYIVPCRRSDPNINKCIVEHGNEIIPKLRDGDRKFKLPQVNPLRINEVVLEPGANLKLAMKDIDVIGLDKIKILTSDINFKENTFKMTLDIPQINLLGDYEIDGRILILPIVGAGKSNVTCDNLHITYHLNFKEEVKNGINQFGVVDNNVDYTATRIYYHFGNLFNGEPRLVKEMDKFLDENWKEIDVELHDSFNQIIASIIKNFIGQVAQDIPFDTLFEP